MGRQAGPARCRDDVFEGVPAFVRVLGARQTCPQWGLLLFHPDESASFRFGDLFGQFTDIFSDIAVGGHLGFLAQGL